MISIRFYEMQLKMEIINKFSPSTLGAFIIGIPYSVWLASTSVPPITPYFWGIRFTAAFIFSGLIGHSVGQALEDGPPRHIIVDIYKTITGTK